MRVCLNKTSTYSEQVVKYKLNESEQKELQGLLRDVGYNV